MDIKFLLLLAGNGILFLLIRRTKQYKRLNGFLTVTFTVLLTLTLIEAGYRFIFKKKGITETGNYGGSFNTPVDLTGFTVKNIADLHTIKKDAKGNVIYDVHYSVIPDSGVNTLPINHRVAYHLADAKRDSVDVVFLGCSFTFATGISDTATMAYKVGRQLQYNSLNYGSPGYGTHQVYQIFEHKFRNAPDQKRRVFVYTFIPDHLLRAKCIYSWCLNDPFFEVKNDSLVLDGPAYKYSSGARSQVLVRVLSLNRTLSFVADLGNNIVQQRGASSVSSADYRRIAVMLEKINEDIHKRGDEFIILNWDDYKGIQKPGGGYYFSPDSIRAIMGDLSTRGAIVADVSSFFQFNDQNLIPADNHPSGRGNAILADYLGGLIRQKCGIR